VRAVLDRSRRERPSGSAWTALAMLSCIGIAAPVAAMQLVAAEPPAPAIHPNVAAAAVPAVEHAMAAVPAIPDVAPAVEHAMAATLPRIPAIVAGATSAVPAEEVEQALREAELELRHAPHLTRRQLRTAMRQAEAARAEARAVSHREIRTAMRELERVQRDLPRQLAAAHAGIVAGAEGMLRGAEGMERGARNMEREADRLLDRDYRERQIARARARGETVTHEDLLEAAEGLREGAEGLREGAQDMRESAAEMRERDED
ncbi:MAG TPA: hypothetical protein VGX37_11865, partial [Allosphingosinicella sp.]|nr:hypothetical protein [Allosphingosinicella sp.]